MVSRTLRMRSLASVIAIAQRVLLERPSRRRRRGRLNTTRVAASFLRLSSNSCCSASARLTCARSSSGSCRCRPLQLVELFDDAALARRQRMTQLVPDASVDRDSVCSRTMRRLRRNQHVDSASSSAGRRLRISSSVSSVILATSAFCADTGIDVVGLHAERLRDRVAPGARSRASISSSLRSASQRPSILLRIDEMRLERLAVADDASARLEVALGDAGVGGEHEQHRMRARDQDSVSSGSVPMAFSPGVSRMTRPCLSSGCGKVDDRVTPARDLDHAVGVDGDRLRGRRPASYSPYMRASSTATRRSGATELGTPRIMLSTRSVLSGCTTHFGRLLLELGDAAERERASRSAAADARRQLLVVHAVRSGTSSCGRPTTAGCACRSWRRRWR